MKVHSRIISAAAAKALLPAAAVLLLLGACVTIDSESGRSEPQSFSGIRRLVLRGANSHIALQGTSGDEVLLYNPAQSVRREGSSLYLTVRGAEQFRMQVPEAIRITAENSNGSYLTAGILGRQEAVLNNTEAVIISPGPELSLATTNAPIDILKKAGPIQNYSAETTNAAIHAVLPPEDLTISLETSNSYFRVNNLPVTLLERNQDQFRGYIGSRDAGKLSLKTTNRSITLEPVETKPGTDLLTAAVSGNYSQLLHEHLGRVLGSFANRMVRDTLQGILAQSLAIPASSRELSPPQKPQKAQASQEAQPPRTAEPEEPQELLARRTAVFPFEETNSPARELGLGPALSEMLITSVANSPAVTVVERSRMETLLQEAEIQQAAYTSRDQSIEVGKMANSEIIIVGSVARFGSHVELDTRVIRAETGEVLFTQYGSSAEDKLRPMVNTLGEEICQSIASLDVALSGSTP